MKSWYVVRTQTQSEERAARQLLNQEFEVYLPRYRKERRHARKVDMVLRPLFPGYLFVGMDPAKQRWRSINGTFGVIGLVQYGEVPTPVPAGVVENLQNMEDTNGAVSLAPQGLKKGDRVRVRTGAFAEYTALLEEISDEKRVFLLLDLMGREVRVTAPLEALAAVS